MGHRRWLEHDHCWRRDIRSFDGNEDLKHAPIPHSEDDVLNEIENIDLNNKNDFRGPWKKKSIFFKLPYWKSLLLPHNLDVMHIEKNVCDNITRQHFHSELPSHKRKKSAAYEIDEKSLAQAHHYMLFMEHKNIIKGKHLSRRIPQFELEKIHCKQFSEWFRKRVERLEELSDLRVIQEIKWLARGPNNFVRQYSVDKVFYAKDPQLEGWLVVRHVKVKDAFNMGCNFDQNSLYSIPDTCDVTSLHRNEVDGGDEIDVTESMKDEKEEEEDTY
uniref:DUF4216 domain-containing protein n=1 Tax=Tanacetum cinerariifolium TaxID=118510 RepID=A0A6L2LS78_TANCI|nr:uncharacterized protein [Tanacetum cinerariifolium]